MPSNISLEADGSASAQFQRYQLEPTLLSIHSTSSNRELVFSQFDGENFIVELKGFEVAAIARVSAYTDSNGLNKFLRQLGLFEKPWQGQKSWASIEGDFSISARCSSLGSVTFVVKLRGLQGAPEEWLVEVGLVVDFGQLEKISKDSEAYFNANT